MHRLAIFGGTFNPIHNGHLHLGHQCAEKLGLERILLMPTHRPPHKETDDLASDEHRFAMCRLAVQNDSLFEVSDLEIKRAGVSYTIDTLEELHRQYPEEKLYFILGSDMLFILNQWYRYQDILKLATVVAGAREAEELARMHRYHREVLQNHPKVQILSFDALPVSSTELRERVCEKNSNLSPLLPPLVEEYIREHGLYCKGGLA